MSRHGPALVLALGVHGRLLVGALLAVAALVPLVVRRQLVGEPVPTG